MKKRPNEEEETEKENSQDEEREREAEGEDTMEQSISNGKEQKLRNKNHLPKGEFHAKYRGGGFNFKLTYWSLVRHLVSVAFSKES